MRARLAWLLSAVFAVVAVVGCRGDDPSRGGPPPTPREDVVEVIHGREVHDPYRWLEAGDRAGVRAWVRRQDLHARSVLGASAHRQGFRNELRRMWDRDAIVGPVDKRGDRYFYGRRHKGRDKTVYYVREGLRGRERVLIDPAKLSDNGSLGVRSIYPSRDGNKVAYAVSRNNADAATLYVRDVNTGTDLRNDMIPGARFASPQWAPDNQSFYYTGLPDDPTIPPSKLAGHASVRRHVLGQPPAHDEVVFGPTGDARTFLAPGLVFDGRYLLVHVIHGAAGAADIYFQDLKSGGELQPLTVGSGATNIAFGYRDRFYLFTSEGAPRYRLIEIDPQAPARSNWREVVPQGEHVLNSVALMNGHLILNYLDDVNARVIVRRLDDGRSWPVELPSAGAVAGIWTDPSVNEALIAFSSLAQEGVIYRVPIPAEARATATPELFWAPEDLQEARDAQLVMRQLFTRSPDGAQISVFVLHRGDLVLDGQNPTVLYGYGGFGIPITPGYNPLAALWAQRGGVWAQASIRGGGEYGEDWHRAGKRGHKQDVFNDFIGAAEHLVAAGYASPATLGIMGGSNGGLLVGAASTQRPDLFGAVVCQVPLLDMIRYPKFGLGELWIDEYGDPEDPSAFAALYEYSPYHQIRAGVRYPSLLMMSADTDDRVDPLHARKYVAAMQHASAGEGPVLLRTQAQAGHGGPDSVTGRIESYADILSFLLTELAPNWGKG
ncbi:Prolyl endopeptidase [Enhygromyxa salina]|uniref:prolyl oligopeptidase n=1 Tax=Enhygromyxa salina TaxID=215803 RepID=A0A0C2D9B2_9BACT|nr:prolyl oligopeptidase family serine peptidase [Enhygromyxa salina]KIG19646.1 Prolyl endopeptidase [Enhygromyxa salina]